MSSQNQIEQPFFGASIDNVNFANICVIGIPWDASSSYRDGAHQSPIFIRSATSGKLYNHYSEKKVNIKEKWQILDIGDAQITNRNVLQDRKTIFELINSYNRYGMKFLFLGGDHLSTYFTFWSLRQLDQSSRIGIIYLDAHPDLYDNYEGNNYSHACVLKRIIDETHIDSTNIIQIGIRATTPEQEEYANKAGITTITTQEFQQIGAHEAANIAKTKLPKNLDKIYVSIDLDVLDPAYAPGVGNPQPGGLTTREVVSFIQNLEGLKINAFDVVELCPKIDYSGTTAFTSAIIIKEMLGIMEK